jgi:hypothetical protein
MNPFTGIADFCLGLIREGHFQGWMRLIASLVITAFVSFFGTFSLSTLSQVQAGVPVIVAFPLAIAHGSLMMSLMVLALWLRSPLTKGIAILYPGKLEAARLEQLVGDGTVFNPNDGKR